MVFPIKTVVEGITDCPSDFQFLIRLKIDKLFVAIKMKY